MRVLNYPPDSMLYTIGFHGGCFRLVTTGQVTHNYDTHWQVTLLSPDFVRTYSLTPRSQRYLSEIFFRSSLATDASGERLGLLADDKVFFDLLTGRTTFSSVGYVPLPKPRTSVHLAWDDRWVIMNADSAKIQGNLVMGPSAYADGVHLPRGGEPDDDHLIVYRRGGAARTLKLPIGIHAPRIYIAPDSLTALVAGARHHAVVIDLE